MEAVDGFTAFVAERRSDDPAIYRRIVIARRRTKQHAYTIHTPQGMDVWIVVSAAEGEDVGTFPTVRAALEFVQPVSVGVVAPAEPAPSAGQPLRSKKAPTFGWPGQVTGVLPEGRCAAPIHLCDAIGAKT